MKRYVAAKFLFRFLIVLLLLGCWAQGVYAAEEGKPWRSTYDAVLLWVNFVIFVFILVKYARMPLKNFLHGKKAEIEKQIHKLEAEKNEAAAKVEQMIQSVERNKVLFAEMKQKIIAQGQQKKDDIIADSRAQSRLLLAEAKRKIDNQILQAKNQLKAELVDSAIDLAIERLPREITPQDNQKFIQKYLQDAPSGE